MKGLEKNSCLYQITNTPLKVKWSSPYSYCFGVLETSKKLWRHSPSVRVTTAVLVLLIL